MIHPSVSVWPTDYTGNPSAVNTNIPAPRFLPSSSWDISLIQQRMKKLHILAKFFFFTPVWRVELSENCRCWTIKSDNIAKIHLSGTIFAYYPVIMKSSTHQGRCISLAHGKQDMRKITLSLIFLDIPAHISRMGTFFSHAPWI